MNSKNLLILYCCKCKSYIFSRVRNDFRSCNCESVFIDGGFDYCKTSITNQAYIKKYKGVAKLQAESLFFEDWKYKKDKYGIHKSLTEISPFFIITEIQSDNPNKFFHLKI